MQVFLGFKSGLIQMFWTFILSFDLGILTIFCLGNCFGYIFQTLGQFFLIIWSHFKKATFKRSSIISNFFGLFIINKLTVLPPSKDVSPYIDQFIMPPLQASQTASCYFGQNSHCFEEPGQSAVIQGKTAIILPRDCLTCWQGCEFIYRFV